MFLSKTRRRHWESVYGAKPFTDVSWYQERPARSLEFIEAAGLAADAPIIDVGGGASTLVDHLLARGYRDVTVLDVSDRALAQAQQRLGERAASVAWIASDVTAFRAQRQYRLWHDRAVLHFLTEPADRSHYVEVLRTALAAGGHLVVAAFGPGGPLQCSGLDVRRYSVEMLAELLGPDFELEHEVIEDHRTPWGGTQQFLYTHWRLAPA